METESTNKLRGDLAIAKRKASYAMRNSPSVTIECRDSIALMIRERHGLSWVECRQTADALCNLLFDADIPVA